MRVALFGGSFDPPHVGHVLAAAYALSVADVEKVLVVPVFAHAFDKELSAFGHRVAMTELAMQELRHVEVSRVEETLGAPSRTLRTLEHLLEKNPGDEFRLLIGADVLVDSSKWHAFDEVVRLAPPLVLGRAGVAHPDAPEAVLPNVSSTRVRAVLRSTPGARTDHPDLSRWVPRSVLRYADEKGLYR